MKCLTSNEALNICSNFLVERSESEKGSSLHLRSGDEFPLWGKFSQEHSKQEFLMHWILDETSNSGGHLVWLRDWNIFSKDGGLFEIIECFRKCYGETRKLSESPVFCFDPSEAYLAKDLVRILLGFDWGCYVIPLNGKALVEFYDEDVAFWSFDEKIRDELKPAIDWQS